MTARNLRAVAIAAIIALTTIVAPTTAQAAAPAEPYRSVVTTGPGEQMVTPMVGQPSGCPSAHFCVYKNGNGGDLCLANSGDNSWWGAGCANDGETLFNNGVPDPYEKVRMYWGADWVGAWGCLDRGSYWLYATTNYFNYGSSLLGYGQPIGNNAASHRWTQTCG